LIGRHLHGCLKVRGTGTSGGVNTDIMIYYHDLYLTLREPELRDISVLMQ